MAAGIDFYCRLLVAGHDTLTLDDELMLLRLVAIHLVKSALTLLFGLTLVRVL